MAIAPNMEIGYFTWPIVIFGDVRKLVRDVTGRALYLSGPNLFPIRYNAGRERSANESARVFRRLCEISTRCAQDMRDLHKRPERGGKRRAK